ncbi:Uncharacterized protein TCM_033317 [Theobroma cacao]|uniref:Uncharacterized protein n=1 Tax=Theobroma cacao TaxID=3641 RepID=A0A061FHY8_THECC|nr:Uncharacterized protein TCM_033317 [Theobroma cacao]
MVSNPQALSSIAKQPMASPNSNSTTSSLIVSSNRTLLYSNQQIPLITINATTRLPIKFISLNFPSRRNQFKSLLIGYKLLRYVDGTFLCLPTMVTQERINPPTMVSNPTFDHWTRQDQLLSMP